MWGGLLAGLCLVLPAFFILLMLTMAYATLGVTPIGRGALYGVGPVVLGILGVAAYRLGKSTVCTIRQTIITIVAVAALIWSSLGIAAILLLACGEKTAKGPRQYTIGMSQCNLGEPWRVQMNADVKAAAQASPSLAGCRR